MLYEKPAALRECEVDRDQLFEVEHALAFLERGGYVEVRYAITPAGSAYLASLTEQNDVPREAALG